MEVDYFMWGFQSHYLMSAQFLFDGLCGLLGCNLKPSMFLVGFLQGKPKGFLPVCVEPDECAFQPEVFDDAVEQARQAVEAPRDTIVIPPSEWHPQDHERRYWLGCLARAVLDAVEAKTDGNLRLTFCTRMVKVENYLVALVLQIDKAARDSWPHLHIRTSDDYRLPVSLIDCVIDEFLTTCADDLSKPEPGRWLGEVKDRTSIIRSAGRSFMYKASAAGNEFHGLHGLFEACNTIASLRYESAEGAGTIIIARKDHPAIDRCLVFANPVALSDYRAARKLLELCRGPLALICNSHVILGLGKVSDRYDAAQEDVFEIRFVQQHTWELVHAAQVLMRTTYGTPALPQQKFNASRFTEVLRRVIPGVTPEAVERLVALARKSSEVKHGTMLVVSPKAKDEAARLERQGTRIEPITLTPDVLGLATTIDGAVLLAPDATCHGIGVILDGRATPKGTPSRGARYNSAVRYVEQEKDSVAVVVSEDGTIDILPDLLPQISRSGVDGMVRQLRNLSTAKEPDENEYGTVMHWLDKHRFYLPADACDEINRLWKLIDERCKGGGFRPVYEDFKPNPDMNDSFFTTE
jgi:DNA integrity scanning protein DisA with diadenylate cyclase activity